MQTSRFLFIKYQQINSFLLILLILSYGFFISNTSPSHSVLEPSDIVPNANSHQDNSLDTFRVFSSDFEGIGPRVLRIGSLYAPLPSDPMYPFSGATIRYNSLIYDSLVEFDLETGKVSPALARQWIISADSKHWIFLLRNDVFFHDGTPFNSSVVKYNLDRILDPDHPAYVEERANLDEFPLESVNLLGEDIVEVNFYRPYAPFLNGLTTRLIVSPSSFNVSGQLVTPIGTGPYMLDLETSNETFHNLTRFYHHFRGLAPFEEVHYLVYQLTSPEFISAVISHEIDFIPTSLPKEVESDDDWEIIQTRESSLQALGFFNHNSPILSNRLVRQALNYAINKQDMNDTLFGGVGSPMHSLIPPSVEFHDNSLPGFPFNVSYANSLLDSAGYLKGADGYRFSLDLSGFTFLTNHTNLINFVVDSFDLIGVKANVFEFEGYDRFFSGDYDVYILGIRPSFDASIVRGYLHSDGGLNTGNYSNSIIDDLIVLGESTPIKQEREFYYSTIDPIVQFEVPLLLLSNVGKRFAIAKNLSSLVTMNKNTKIVFNFTLPSPTPVFKIHSTSEIDNTYSNDDSFLFEYQDISIPDYSVYFPEVDLVFDAVRNSPLNVRIQMSNDVQFFLPSQHDKGKFFSIVPSDSSQEYFVRCYYNLNEINSSIPLEALGLLQWDESDHSWHELVSTASNSSLRFVEVKLSGSVLIKFGEILSIEKLTFYFLPLAIFFTLGIGGVIIVIIRGNTRFLRNLKEKYQL